MQYWYPTQSRVEALSRELGNFERLAAMQAADAVHSIAAVSAELAKAGRRSDFPGYQLPRWLWLASQFRLHAGTSNVVAAKTGAALHFLAQRLVSESLVATDVQDLNWVLESTIRSLSHSIPAQDLRSCLSGEELARVDSRLSQYAEAEHFDAEAVRSVVAAQLRVIRSLSAMSDLADIEFKVETLFEAAARSEGEFRSARAALLYLAEENDVVADTIGVLGLIDDIYVIEWAYAAVESQTRCLPILEGLIRKWPFVADLAVLDGGRTPLNRFSQYVTCAALYSLFVEAGPGLLVLREPGPYPMLAAFMAAVECSRRQTLEFGTEIASWPRGQPLYVSDGVSTFRATFEGTQELHGLKYRLGVRDAGVILVGQGTLPYLARAPRPHGRLSSGTEISIWLKDRHLDPMVNLTGSGRGRSSPHEAVLLLGPKHKLDELIGSIRLFGVTPQALLGVKYLNAHHEASDGKGSVTDYPLIYACSVPSVAADLLREPPAHVARWKVIVDGAKFGRSLCGVTSTTAALAYTPICVLAELFEREATADLIRMGLGRVWYLEDQDVEAPLYEAPPRSKDLLSRMLARRSAHWSSTHTVHDVEDEFLEAVAECLRDRGAGFERSGEASFLDLTVSMFLQKALSCAMPIPKFLDDLRTIGRSIAAQASVQRAFDPTAARLHELFGPFSDGKTSLTDRKPSILKIVRAADDREAVAVICRSADIADQCRFAATSDSCLAKVEWLNIERLRREAPYDRIVVPAWLDRMSIRELAFNGYAPRLDFVLLPFERRWFDGTTTAIRRWERQLEGRSLARLSAAAESVGDTGGLARRWEGQTRLRLAALPVADLDEAKWEDDEPDTDQLEARAVEAVARIVTAQRVGDPRGRAQLVLFEDAGAYALLPPNGRVIVLSETLVGNRSRVRQNAERMLMRNVAELRPGMVLAFSLGGERDLIDAKADQFLIDSASVRRCAALWKAALRRSVGDDEQRVAELCRRMAKAGQPRDPGTVRFWIHYDQTIAPRNYRTVVPLLATLTNDVDLKAQLNGVLQAVDLIYRARALAAQAIVDQLFSGEIDLAHSSLTFSIGGKQLVYTLHRVRRIGNVLSVPMDLIGKVGTFTAFSGEAA